MESTARLRARDLFDYSISSAAGSRTSLGLSLLFHGGGVLLVVAGAWSLDPIPSLSLRKPCAPLMLAAPPVERPERVAEPPVRRAPPPVTAPKPQFQPPPRTETLRLALEPAVTPEVSPELPPVIAAQPAALIEHPLAPPPKPAVKTDLFAHAPTPEAPIAKTAKSVRIGNFAPAGLPEPARPGRRMLAKVGVFETAGAESAAARRPAVAVGRAGFSSPSQDPAAPALPAGGIVRSGGFGDAVVEATAQSHHDPNAQTGNFSGVKILFEPRPAYSEEARRLRIEGEVVLDALFSTSGEVRVLRVVKRLGHGLDEAAVEAAQKIRFQPAQRAGQPVDCTATVHITFQLAY